ncbi:MAG: hypothetical protein II978_08760, partial [Clostridia bacterium]|nr:hypothetical protein [Clostridia bacterium]
AEEYTQVIKYSTDGIYVDKIITYTGETNRSNPNVLNIDNLEAEELTAQTGVRLGKYTISGSGLIIPADRVNDKYVGKSATYTQGGKYKVQLVDATEGNSVKAVLIYGANTSLSSTNMHSVVPAVVTKVTGQAKPDETYEEALNVFKVKTITGEEKTYYSKGEEEYKKYEGSSTNKWSSDLEVPAEGGEGNFRGIKPGDIVKVIADDKYILEEIMIVAKAEDVVSADQKAAIASDGTNVNMLNAQYRYFLGTARKALPTENNLLVLTAMYPDDENWAVEDKDESYNISDSTKIFIVDTEETNETRVLSEGAVGDIQGYNTETEKPSKLFVYQTSGTIKAIVIFKYPEE